MEGGADCPKPLAGGAPDNTQPPAPIPIVVDETQPKATQIENTAARGVDPIVQLTDWTIIGNDPDYATGSQQNIDFINHYYKGGSGYSDAQINASWQAYNNWLAGIDDGASHYFDWSQGWEKTAADFRGYKNWYVDERKTSFNAVPHNVF